MIGASTFCADEFPDTLPRSAAWEDRYQELTAEIAELDIEIAALAKRAGGDDDPIWEAVQDKEDEQGRLLAERDELESQDQAEEDACQMADMRLNEALGK